MRGGLSKPTHVQTSGAPHTPLTWWMPVGSQGLGEMLRDLFCVCIITNWVWGPPWVPEPTHPARTPSQPPGASEAAESLADGGEGRAEAETGPVAPRPCT